MDFRLRALAPAGIIALLGLAAHIGSLDTPFQYDDIHSIAENPHVRSLGNIPRFFADPSLFSADPRNAMYRPLVLVSYALNHALSGYEVWSYHLVNLGLHLAASCLVYALLLQLGATRLPALLAGLLFALHPLASEPVNYLSSRSETLCALLLLLAFLCHLRGAPGWRAAGLASFCGALLAKSTAIALPPLLLLYELLFRKAELTWRQWGRRQGPYWLAALAYAAGTWSAIDAAMVSHPVRTLPVQVFTQVKAGVYYLKLLCLPWGLSAEHQFILAAGPGEGPVLAALLCLAALGVLFLRRPCRAACFWGVWAVLTLLPSSGVPLNVLVNEHRLYLPGVAFAALLGGLLARLVEERGRWGAVAAALWLGGYGALAWQRSQVWQSPESLWGDAARKAPGMPRPHLYLGDCLQRAGRHEEALREYALARTVYPQVLSAGDQLAIYNNQGAALLALGRRNEAMASYRRALAIDPTYAKSREALDALVALQEANWHPAAQALHKKGLILLIENRPAEALAALQQSLQYQARLETYRALGMAYEQLGRWAEARQVYADLRALAPESPFGRGAGEKLRELEGNP